MLKTEILINSYLQYLCNYINFKKEDSSTKGDTNKITATVEDIFANLSFLTKSDNESNKTWLPVDIRRMLFFILYGNTGYYYTTVEKKENMTATATTSIYVDEKFIASFSFTVAYEDVFPFDSTIGEQKRNCIMEFMAIGGSESRALYRAGIGMQFTGDMEYYSGNNNDQLNPVIPLRDNEQPVPANSSVMEAMENILNGKNSIDSTTGDKDSQNEDDFNKICLFGNNIGKKFSEVTGKYLAWMLACIDAHREDAEEVKEQIDECYYNNLMSIVMSDSIRKKMYETFMKSA